MWRRRIGPGGGRGCCCWQTADSFNRMRQLCSGVVGGLIGGLGCIEGGRRASERPRNKSALVLLWGRRLVEAKIRFNSWIRDPRVVGSDGNGLGIDRGWRRGSIRRA
jgi:hypothetical protein